MGVIVDRGTHNIHGMPKASGVYVILNVTNGKKYIGSATNMATRMVEHRSILPAGKHHNKHLQNSYNLYGPNAFVFGVHEFVPDTKELLTREQAVIDNYPREVLLNHQVVVNCRATVSGRVVPDGVGRKISAATKGKKKSEETKAALRGPNHYAYGTSVWAKHKEDVLERLKNGESLRSIGRQYGKPNPASLRYYLARLASESNDQAFIELVSSGNKGFRHSEKTKAKIRNTKLNSCKLIMHKEFVEDKMQQGLHISRIAELLYIRDTTLRHFIKKQRDLGNPKLGYRRPQLAKKVQKHG